MDNRKLRYAKRKAKEKILSQRDRAYYRNLNFHEKRGKDNSRGKSFENKEDGQKPFLR